MALTRKQWTWIFAGIVLVIIVIVLIAFWDKFFGVRDPNKDGEPTPQGSPTPKWVPESFPLNVGMYGTKTKKLQEKIGIEADGKFGNQTKSSVVSAGYNVPLSEPDYEKIVNPGATGGGANFTQLKSNLGNYTNFQDGVMYAIQGKNENYVFYFYTNGRFFLSVYNTPASAYIKKGTYTNGGKNLFVDGGKNYFKSDVKQNLRDLVNDYGK